MGILKRAANILSANVNDMFDKWENPEKMAKQAIINMKRDLATVRKEAAGVMATADNLGRRYEAFLEKAGQFGHAAENALLAGNEAAATKLLVEQEKQEKAAADMKVTYEAAKQAADEMKSLHNKLVDDIQTLEGRIAKISANVAVANATNAVSKAQNRLAAGRGTDGALSRWEDKSQAGLDAARANASLTNQKSEEEDLLSQFANGPATSSVNSRLEALKAKHNVG
jgi:phage shock protein A